MLHVGTTWESDSDIMTCSCVQCGGIECVVCVDDGRCVAIRQFLYRYAVADRVVSIEFCVSLVSMSYPKLRFELSCEPLSVESLMNISTFSCTCTIIVSLR